MAVETEHRLPTRDGVEICLVQVSASGVDVPAARHVLMTHGLFSDRRICLGLAQFLADRGFICWILEWRGHGASARPPQTFDFETVARQDVPAALTYLTQCQGVSRLDCVAHSGGGIVLTMALVREPAWRDLMGRWALVACQTSGAAAGWWPTARLWLTRAACAGLGRLPGWLLGLGPQDESRHMLQPWFDWNLNRHFIGRDGLDYRRAMSGLGFPVLALAAEGDRLIAPPAGCHDFWRGFGGPANQFRLSGPRFGHASLMSSRAARSDIWPVVLGWLTGPSGTHEAPEGA